ncbi:hypothetical protein Tco_1289117, partial [Tanacetum coccineum]
EITIKELRKKLERIQKEKDTIQFNVDKFENASKSLNKIIECQIVDNCKKGLGYIAVAPPYTGNFMPPTLDLSFTGLDKFVNEPIVQNCKAMPSEEEPKVVRKNDGALIIEEWVSGDEEEDESQPKIEKKIVRPSIVEKKFVKSKQQEKTGRKTIKQIQVSDGLGPQKKLILLSDVQSNPQLDLQDKGVIDSGCSRHMTRNMSYLTDYEEIDGGYVTGKAKKNVRLMMEKLVIRENRQRVLVRKRIERIGENKNRKRVVWNKNKQSDLVSKRIKRIGELKNKKRVKYIKNRQSVWNGIRVNAGDSKLMLLGINFILLVKVNAVMHKLTTASES